MRLMLDVCIILIVLFILSPIDKTHAEQCGAYINPPSPKTTDTFKIDFEFPDSQGIEQWYEIQINCEDYSPTPSPIPVNNYNQTCWQSDNGRQIKDEISGLGVGKDGVCHIVVKHKTDDTCSVDSIEKYTCNYDFFIGNVTVPKSVIVSICDSKIVDTSGAWAKGVNTGLGCVPYDPQYFVLWVLVYFVPLAGGVGFLVLLGGAFSMMTAAGNPEKIAKAQRAITAAVAGIIFIVFGIFLLRIAGVNLLRIPGF